MVACVSFAKWCKSSLPSQAVPPALGISPAEHAENIRHFAVCLFGHSQMLLTCCIFTFWFFKNGKQYTGWRNITLAKCKLNAKLWLNLLSDVCRIYQYRQIKRVTYNDCLEDRIQNTFKPAAYWLQWYNYHRSNTFQLERWKPKDVILNHDFAYCEKNACIEILYEEVMNLDSEKNRLMNPPLASYEIENPFLKQPLITIM